MADSIAKLSVIITGDAGPLNLGLRAGAANVAAFQRRVESGTSSVLAFSAANRMAGATAGNLLRLSGAAAGINSGFLGLAKGGGGVGLLTAGLAILMYRSAQAAENMEADAEKIRQAYDKAFDAASIRRGEVAKIDFPDPPDPAKLDEWSRAVDTWTSKVGGAVLEMGRHIRQQLEWIPQMFNNAFRDQSRDATLKRQKQEADRAREMTALIQRQSEAQKRASEEFARKLESLRSRAESLAESLRTPAQVYADAVNELRNLGSIGLLNPEQVTAGIRKAKDELLAAAKVVKSTHDIYRPTGASERFSQSAASAVNEARAAEQAQIALAKQLLEQEKAQRKLLEEANRLAKERSEMRPVNLVRGSL